MDAVDRGARAAERSDQGRDLRSERLPPHVTIPVVAATSLALWVILFRGFSGLLALLH